MWSKEQRSLAKLLAQDNWLHGWLGRYLWRKLPERIHDREDCLQDWFLYIVERAETFDGNWEEKITLTGDCYAIAWLAKSLAWFYQDWVHQKRWWKQRGKRRAWSFSIVNDVTEERNLKRLDTISYELYLRQSGIVFASRRFEDEEAIEAVRYEICQKLSQASGVLSRRQKHIIDEYYFRGQTYEAIGKTLGISKQAVCSSLTFAKRALREFLPSDMYQTIATIRGE